MVLFSLASGGTTRQLFYKKEILISDTHIHIHCDAVRVGHNNKKITHHLRQFLEEA